MTLFILMKREPEYTGIGGYLNSENRSDVTDSQLMIAVETLGIKYSDLFLWVNSRCARHFMDTRPTAVNQFVTELVTCIPKLRAESI